MIEESDADRLEREAERIQVPPPHPGDDPPTYGDEGGGNLFPERRPDREPTFLRRLAQRLGLSAPASPRRPA